MYSKTNRPAPSKNEPKEVITFNFSESKSPIRNIFVDGEPHFIGSDLTKALAYKNSRKALKDHCRYVTKRYIPHPQSENKTLQVLVIPESDIYRLIIKSTLPKAQEFERWLMEDVLPSLRKKGYYTMSHQQKDDFIDARALIYDTQKFNNKPIRCIEIDKEELFSINDINFSIGSRTGSCQTAKKLNVKETLAKKVWLYGVTNPAWFTTKQGFQLIVCGSRTFNKINSMISFSNQLSLGL